MFCFRMGWATINVFIYVADSCMAAREFRRYIYFVPSLLCDLVPLHVCLYCNYSRNAIRHIMSFETNNYYILTLHGQA